MKRATTLPEILPNMQKSVMHPEDYDRFWVDTSEARGENTAASMAEYLRALKHLPMKVLFAGHRGSGKSTELHTLQRLLEEEFLVVPFSVQQHLDILNLKVVDLLLLIMERVHDRVTRKAPPDPNVFYPELKLDAREWGDLRRWLQESTLIETKDVSADAEAKAGVGGKLLGVIFGEISSAIRFSSSRKTEIRERLEPRISELVDQSNRLLSGIEAALGEYQRNRLLIVIEDLDKLRPEDAEGLFQQNGGVLARLGTHTIFTIPNALYYGHSAPQIFETFGGDFLLPMIKVKTRQGEAFKSGIAKLTEVLEKRIDLSLIDERALSLVVEKSGGLIRDMFDVITRATLDAMSRRQQKIDMQAVERGLNKLKARYERSIAETDSTHGQIAVEDYYRKLWSVRRSRSKKEANDKVLLDLLLSSSVIEYNSERWLDVHPLVADHLDERGGEPSPSDD